MNKIIAAFDGLKFSNSSLQYAVQLAKQSNSHLTGVFLDDFSNHSYKIYELIKEEGGHFEKKQKQLDQQDAEKRAQSVKKFEEACRKAGIEHSMHRDRTIAIQALLHESIYADLLIIDYNETLTAYTEKAPTHFIRQLLTDVQCPVLATPKAYKPINKLVLLYDGEPSSVYAIKMLSYSLASLKQFDTEVISVNPSAKSLHVPDNRLMKEFMKRHFPQAKYTVLKGFAETEIVQFLKKQKDNPLVVLGAYRRSIVSRWFRESMADVLMRELKMPLFIAHSK
jgi:nucleotide-binding universal stress UspA family protein